MASITQTWWLRPVRLGFLVDPASRAQVAHAVSVCSRLWGGMFNCIIPHYRRRPRWWTERNRPPRTGPEIVAGYLQYFDPDYVVIPDGTAVDLPPHLAKRTLAFPEVEGTTASGEFHGVDVCDVYEWMGETEYRFQAVGRRDTVLPQAETELGVDSLMTGIHVGPEGTRTRTAFEHSFRPTIKRDRLSMLERFRAADHALRTPLIGGSARLRIQSTFPYRLAIVLLDPRQTADIIAFWNLRAAGWSAVPVSVTDSVEAVVQALASLGEHGSGDVLRVVSAPSVSSESLHTFAAEVATAPWRVAVTAYPHLWEAPRDRRQREAHSRPKLYVATGTDELDSSSPRLKAPRPPFISDDAFLSRGAWALVVRLEHYGQFGPATVFPQHMESLRRIISFGSGSVRPGPEGIVVELGIASQQWAWRLPDPIEVFESWFDEQGWKLSTSSAGRIAYQLLRRIEGPWGAASIANAELIRLLDNLAHGLVAPEDPHSKPSARGRLVSYQRLRRTLKEAVKRRDLGWTSENADDLADMYLNRLISQKVLSIGLSLTCPSCGQPNWHAPKQLDETLNCSSCLEEFPFPSTPPDKSAWKYRATGPFSVANFADGSYTVALALRFLTVLHDAHCTWTTGFELQGPAHARPLEVDFAAIWCPKSYTDAPMFPRMLFSECKTFSSFGDKDLARAATVLDTFPNAGFIFASLRDSLSEKEVKAIRRLASAGRTVGADGRWRHPIIVLTSNELFAFQRPPAIWKASALEGPHMTDDYGRLGGITDLAEATQVLYLGMDRDPFAKR